MHLRLWILTALLIAAVSPACAQLSDAQVVSNAYPKDLAAEADADPDRPEHWSTFVTADLNHNGEPLLIALYTDGVRAVVSVVNRGGVVLTRTDSQWLKGFRGELQLIDLDHDGVPEIIVQLISGHGPNIPDSWIYSWSAGKLKLLSPVQNAHGMDITLLSQFAAVDLDGSGKLALLAYPGVRRDENDRFVAVGDGRVYELSNGQYITTVQHFQYAHAFLRHTGKPNAAVQHFTATAGPATLRIINGAGANGISADSALVTLNGATVATSSQFKPKTHLITIPVQLSSDNTVSVELAGKPGAGIWVIVGSVQ